MSKLADFAYPPARSCPFNPPPAYADVSAVEELTRVRVWDGTSPFLLTRYQDVRAALTSPHFSAIPTMKGYPHILEGRKVADQADHSFIRKDDPEHSRLRRMVMMEFTVRGVAKLRPMIQEVVDRLIDNYITLPKGSDLVEHFAAPLPTQIITHMLGVPFEDHEFFHQATRVQFGTTSTAEQVRTSLKEILDYLDSLVTRKQTDPDDDIISRLVVDQLTPGHITRDELLSTIRLLLSAGHQTTQNMTAISVLTLLQHPDQLAIVKSHPEKIPNTVEELLRYSTVLHLGARRVALQDVTINGHDIKAGEGIICATPAANRDPSVFPEPDDFLVERDANGHVAFGFGIHQCLGQVLARVELEIVCSTLFHRLPHLRLAVPLEDIRFRENMFVYGVHSLPLTW